MAQQVYAWIYVPTPNPTPNPLGVQFELYKSGSIVIEVISHLITVITTIMPMTDH